MSALPVIAVAATVTTVADTTANELPVTPAVAATTTAAADGTAGRVRDAVTEIAAIVTPAFASRLLLEEHAHGPHERIVESTRSEDSLQPCGPLVNWQPRHAI